MVVPRLQPHYQAQPDDPGWLTKAVQLHGHLGPWVAVGARMGLAALDELDCPGYFDLEVVARGPLAQTPQSCLLDGLQTTTGATLGKGNVRVELDDHVEVAVTHCPSARTVRLCLRDAVADEIRGLGHDRLETVARDLSTRPSDELFDKP